MPTYSIEGPDGKTYSIDGPEGASRDQVIDAIKKQQAQQQPTKPTQPTKPPEPPASYAGEIAKGAARGPVGLAGDVAEVATAKGLREHVSDLVAALKGDEKSKITPTYGSRMESALGIEPSEQATTGQAVAGSVAETLTNPASWIGPEGWMVKTLSAIGAGTGSELLGEAGESISPALGGLGRIIGGAAGGVIPGAAVKSRTYHETLGDQFGPNVTGMRPLYDEVQIKAQADKGYAWLRDPTNTVQMTPQNIQGLYARIKSDLDAQDADPITAPKTFAMVNQLRPGNIAIGDSRDILSLHNKLGAIQPTAEQAADARAANMARDSLRQWMTQNMPRTSGRKLEKAMGDWSHYEMIKDVRKSLQTAIHRAEVSGTNKNAINTMRQEIRKILDNDSRVRGFPQAARDGMEVVISGGFLENFLRLVGKAVPYSSGFAIISALAQSRMAVPLAATAATSYGARKLGDFLTKGQIERLVTILRQQAPSNAYRTRMNRPRLRQIEPYPRVGATRGALTGGMHPQEAVDVLENAPEMP